MVRVSKQPTHLEVRSLRPKRARTQVHVHRSPARHAHRIHAQLGQLLQAALQVRARCNRVHVQRDVIATRKMQICTNQHSGLVLRQMDVCRGAPAHFNGLIDIESRTQRAQLRLEVGIA